MRLAAITTYAVKGFRGETVATAVVQPRGLDGDRRWMVVDANGRFLSQRELPRMVLLAAHNTDNGILLQAPGAETLRVLLPPTGAEVLPVRVWRDTVPAADGGAAAAAWLERNLGVPCRLVFQSQAASRRVAASHAEAGDVVSFADGFPVLLTSTASLADLNARLASPIGMDRFRPNLVVEGCPAWAEDTWRQVRIGSVAFRVAKPCDRCVVTTTDPTTGERPDPAEPLRTLKTFRRDASGRVCFGQNLVPQSPGSVSVGDSVTHT